MTEKTYRIRPLEWWEDEYKAWCANTAFGIYRINASHSSHSYVTCDQYWWTPCCNSLLHGKQLAEEHYLSRILPALEEVQP